MSMSPMDFSWISDATVSSNLKQLSTPLKKNEHFEVNNAELKIVKTKSLGSKILYFFQENRKNKEVSKLVKDTIIALTNNLPADLDKQKDIQKLFLERLAPLPQEVFDRAVLGDDGITAESKKTLPKILNPNLAKEESEYTSKTARKLERRIEKTKLALQLGIELKPISQGASGSYFARDHKMKIIGVFKPGVEESSSTKTPKLMHKIKNYVSSYVGENPNSSFWAGSGYVSEKLTTVLADHLKIDVIPRSEITTLKSEQFARAKGIKDGVEEAGSYQIFAPKTKSADEMFNLNSMGLIFGDIRLKFNVWRYKDKITKRISQSDFEKMAITDGLILNKDRHFENWLVKKEKNSGADLTHKIVLIDNQLAFPKTNPPITHGYYRRLQNRWEVLPQAKSKFSNEIKEKMTSGLKGDNLKALIEDLRKASFTEDMHIGTFAAPDITTGSSQEFAFKQRVAVLLNALEPDITKRITIREYAAIKSLDEMIASTKNKVDITDPAALDAYLGLA